jgi:hypothetical protein
MASGSIAHSTGAKKPKKPEPARVVQSYWYEVQARGKRGALRRTGELYNISDETVRRYVAADEAKAQPATPKDDELAYIPAPGESTYQAARDAAARALSTHQPQAVPPTPRQRHTPRPRCHTKRHKERLSIRDKVTSSKRAGERGTVAPAATLPHATAPQRHASTLPPHATGWPTTPRTATVVRRQAVTRWDVARVVDVAPIRAVLALEVGPFTVGALLGVAVLIALCLAKATAR